jgi:AcrR family transcriptional regulator
MSAAATGPPVREPKRANARGEATRELILLTAERLFAERGIEATPLRDIGIAADQKNHFAVQYHFGDREHLVRAIAEYRARSLMAIQTEFVADMVAGGRAPELIDIVRSFVSGLAANLDETSHFLPFISRYIIERGGYAGLDDAVPRSAILTIRSILRRLLPEHTEELLAERWEILFTSAVHTLARYQAGMRAHALHSPLDFLIEDLVVSLTALLEASPPPLSR